MCDFSFFCGDEYRKLVLFLGRCWLEWTWGLGCMLLMNRGMSSLLVKCLSNSSLVTLSKLQRTHWLTFITSTRYTPKDSCSIICSLVLSPNPYSLSCPNPDLLSIILFLLYLISLFIVSTVVVTRGTARIQKTPGRVECLRMIQNWSVLHLNILIP